MARILIIEDQPALCRLYKTVLDRDGHDVTLAESGEAGIEAARRITPDLVVLDLILPAMPGVQVARQLRDEGFLDKAPLIVTSGIGGDETRAIAESLGASAVLSKPFDIGSMLDAIKSALETWSGNTSPA
ncbi:MAG: response regulator [Chloroflexi bacterium]|nr:response regulator [Chloroflexota bacterium]